MKILKHSYLAFAVLFLVNCSNDDDSSSPTSNFKTNYADIVLASYEDSLERAIDLQTAINTFVETPTEANFNVAKTAWLQAREPYGQTEAYRFANGPIDNEDLNLGGPEGLINSWPLDEAFVDYVTYNQGTQTSGGIIANTTDYPTISGAVLEGLNQRSDDQEAEVSVGFHAIEFLLWGQDSQIPENGAEGTTGGTRPYTDFVDGGTAENQDRRRDYLVAVTDLLVGHLQDLVNEWDTNGNNYRSTFVALDDDNAIKNILTGIATLVGPELAGERMQVALNNASQEDEHSCFSDNTHRDIRLNFEGVMNVYEGTYKKIDGTTVGNANLSIKARASELTGDDVAVYTTLNTYIDEAETTVNATGVPFDYALTNQVSVIEAAIEDLQQVSSQLALLAAAFGVTVNTGA